MLVLSPEFVNFIYSRVIKKIWKNAIHEQIVKPDTPTNWVIHKNLQSKSINNIISISL